MTLSVSQEVGTTKVDDDRRGRGLDKAGVAGSDQGDDDEGSGGKSEGARRDGCGDASMPPASALSLSCKLNGDTNNMGENGKHGCEVASVQSAFSTLVGKDDGFGSGLERTTCPR